jgi:hypothetical protein
MPRAGCRSALVLAVAAVAVAAQGCGTRAREGAGARPGEVVPVVGTLADAGASSGPADAGAAPLSGGAEPTAIPADAGLAEIGVAPCESVVARFLRCPGVPEESKRQMAEASRRWHEEADRSGEARERIAATCLEIARMTEEMLLKLGC